MNYPTLYLTETSLPEVVFTGGHCEAGKSELEPMRRAPTGKYLSKNRDQRIDHCCWFDRQGLLVPLTRITYSNEALHGVNCALYFSIYSVGRLVGVYAMSNRMLFPFRLSAASTIAAAIVLLTGLSGCGFKSDLFLPEEKLSPATDEETALNSEKKSQTTAVASEGIEVDIATAIASDGEILITPDEAEAKKVPVEVETAVDPEGVPVDISDVGISLNDLVTE